MLSATFLSREDFRVGKCLRDGDSNRMASPCGCGRERLDLVCHRTSREPVRDGAMTDTRVHLIGIGGAGVRALAEHLVDRGCLVSGSEMVPGGLVGQHLQLRGVKLFAGHAAEHVPAHTDFVVYSPAVPLENLERRAARARGIPEYSYPQFLGMISRGEVFVPSPAHDLWTVGISGTHGKSTVTSMIGTILNHAGRTTSLICGAELVGNSGVSGWRRMGTGVDPRELFVVECCEYRRHFLEFFVKTGVILNIEPDHFDCFPNQEAMVAAYREFATRIPREGTLLVGAEARALLGDLNQRVLTFAVSSNQEVADYTAVGSSRGWGSHLIWYGPHGEWGECELAIPGSHNIANALAAVAVCHDLGLTPREIADGLGQFAGLRRRFELIVHRGRTKVVEDYAHHPTAIRATLATARELVGETGTVKVVFQPHQVSRLSNLFEEFVESFSGADEIWVLPVFAAREHNQDVVAVSRRFAARLRERAHNVVDYASVSHATVALTSRLESSSDHDDMWLILGAGDIHQMTETIASQ